MALPRGDRADVSEITNLDAHWSPAHVIHLDSCLGRLLRTPNGHVGEANENLSSHSTRAPDAVKTLTLRLRPAPVALTSGKVLGSEFVRSVARMEVSQEFVC